MLLKIDALTDPKNFEKHIRKIDWGANRNPLGGQAYPPQPDIESPKDRKITVTSEEDWFKIVQESKDKYIFLQLPTGFGKSHSIGNLERKDRVIYCSQRPDLPPTETLQYNFDRFPIRHNNLVESAEKLPDGQSLRTLDHSPSDNPQGNCSFSHVHREFMAKNTEVSICSVCPFSKKCNEGEGEGYGFLHQIKTAVKGSLNFRMHINSLNSVRETDTLVIDEVKASAPVLKTSHIRWGDTADLLLYTDFVNHEHLLEAKIKKYLKLLHEKTHQKAYGMTHEDIMKVTKEIFGEELPKEFKNISQAEDSYIQQIAKDKMRGQPIKLPERWVYMWYLAITSKDIRVSTMKSGLVFTYLDFSVRQKIHTAQQVIFLDATLTLRELCDIYDIPSEEVLVIHADVKVDNVHIHIHPPKRGEITNRFGKNRTEWQRKVNRYYRRRGYGIITWKKYATDEDLTFLNTSRGSNKFAHRKRMIMMGIPLPHYGSAVEEIKLLNPDASYQEISAYYKQLAHSEIVQAIGRLRAHRRQDEELLVKIVANLDTTTLPQFHCQVTTGEDLMDLQPYQVNDIA